MIKKRESSATTPCVYIRKQIKSYGKQERRTAAKKEKDKSGKQSCLKDVTNQNGTITIKTNYVIEMYDYIADVNTKKLIRGEDKEKICILYLEIKREEK